MANYFSRKLDFTLHCGYYIIRWIVVASYAKDTTEAMHVKLHFIELFQYP